MSQPYDIGVFLYPKIKFYILNHNNSFLRSKLDSKLFVNNAPVPKPCGIGFFFVKVY